MVLNLWRFSTYLRTRLTTKSFQSFKLTDEQVRNKFGWFVDALKYHFPEYRMPGLPATAVQDKKILHLKDANTEVFTLGWYPTFIQKKKTELGSIMNQIGYARYDKQ